MKAWLSLVLCVALAACASTSPYKRAGSSTGTGYSERQISENRWRVIFRMRNDNLAAAQDFALLRAAELAVQNGYDWFEVVDRNSDADEHNRGGFSAGFGLSGCGYYGCGSRFGVHSNGSRPRSLSILEVRLGKMPVPGGAQYYDARQLIANLRREMISTPKP